MIRRIHNLSRSVFTRLILIILAAGLLINLVAFLSIGFIQHRSATTYHRILDHYIETLTTAIGDPPSLQRASVIADATGFVISYRAQGAAWRTPETTAPLPPLARYHMRRVSDRTAVGFFRGNTLVRRSLDEGELIFFAQRTESAQRGLRLWTLSVLTALTAILGGAYLLIRRILKPLRHVKRAMEAVHAGDLDHRVLQQGAAEFKALAAAFNAMTVRVGDMLQSKERLLLDVSHELRSPIARIKLALAMMPENAHTQSLREDIREMEIMVNTILEAARMQHTADALKKAPVSLSALVAEALEPLQDRPPGVRIAASPDIHIFADKEKLRSVIYNIVENGIKYSGADCAPVTIAWRAEAAQLTLTVQDHGIGIPPKAIGRVFEPFFRVDDSRSRTTGGFGLGLGLSKTIVEAHGGTIHISNTPPTGTLVSIVLPISPSQAAEDVNKNEEKW